MKTKEINLEKSTSKEIKRPFKVRFMAWVITSLLILTYGLPFIAIGILIGWIIWK